MLDPITSGSKKGMDHPPCWKPPVRVLVGTAGRLHDLVEADELPDDDSHVLVTMPHTRAPRLNKTTDAGDCMPDSRQMSGQGITESVPPRRVPLHVAPRDGGLPRARDGRREDS